MLQGYQVFDADAHGSLSPAMWETLPKEYAVRRPRPVDISDATGLGNYSAGWLIEGRLDKGMVSFASSKTVMDNIDNLYAYLKGRSNGDITRDKVEELKP